MKRPPLFIVFEGIDGSGKSTQARLAHRFCSGRGIPCSLLREPTNGPWGTRIRELLAEETPFLPEEQHRLFLLDRVDDTKNNIIPALDHGITVIMDRYFYSNAAYQGASGLSPETILEDNKSRGFPVPDRVYLIDITPEEAIRRITKRSNGAPVDRFEQSSFLETVRRIYLSISDDSFACINGFPDEEEVHRTIVADLTTRFELP